MEILIALLLLLSLSTILGKLFERVGVTEIVGQIIAGMMLSPAMLNIVQPSSVLSGIAEVAIFFILLFIGLQITTEVLTNHLKSATAFTFSSFVMPVAIMAITAVFIFHLGVAAGVITAVAIGVPSISIISVLVYRYKLVNLEDGKRILSGVIMTDILAFVVLAAALKASHLAGVIISIIIFIAALLYIDTTLRYHDAKVRGFFERMIKEKEESVVFAIIAVAVSAFFVIAVVLHYVGVNYPTGFPNMVGQYQNLGTVNWSAVAIALIPALLATWILLIFSGYFIRQSYGAISRRLNIPLFETGALFYFIGAITVVIMIGFLLLLVAQIIIAIAFFSIPDNVVARKGVSQT